MRAMKNSGVEWIGEIPENWRIIKFKYLYNNSNAGEVIDKGYWNIGEELLYTCQRSPMKSNFSDFPDIKRTTINDLLLTRNATPYIFKPETNAIYSNVVQRVTIKEEFCIDYIQYATQYGISKAIAQGDTIPSYNMQIWDNVYIPNPSIDEQYAIVAYLNKSLSYIDNIIEKQQQVIEKLKEYKLSVITEAVTKGLDPDAEMKDSGVEWIGRIPEKWNVYRIGALYSERKEQGSDELPILTVSINTGVSDRELADDETSRIFVRSEDKSKYMRVYPGDLTYNMMRAWQGAFGAVRVDGMVSPAYVIAKPKREIDSRYMEALLRTPAAKEEMKRYSHGIADFRLRLYWEKFKYLKICFPPIEEQKAIADYLDKKCLAIETAISKKQAILDKLAEYKKSLIYEVVTGKKEV